MLRTKLKISPLVILVSLYLLACLLTLGYWHAMDWHYQTGDEPHYLIMASGIIRHGTLEQTIPYREDYEHPTIYKGWLGSDANPAKNGHTFVGPHGLFNVHGIGLPLLLAIPYGIAGVGGAKVFLILLSSCILVVAWKISSFFIPNRSINFWSTAAVGLALPLLLASSQVFTELPAGLFALIGMYWLLTTDNRRPWTAEVPMVFAIVFLPWLHIKLLLPGAILAGAISWKLVREGHPRRRAHLLLGAFIFSIGLLVMYNEYAFGRLLGPYTEGEFQLSKTSLMVLIGLFLDQAHGFLLQNPVQFVGLFSIGLLIVTDALAAAVWSALFLALLVPNGLYDAWYGAWSFVGRFEWTAAIVFFVPTLLGLARLGSACPRFFSSIIAIGAVIQAQAYYWYTFRNVEVINKWGVNVPLPLPPSYSPFYGHLAPLLPVFGNPSWAFHYPPNYLFGVFALVVFVGGIWFAARDSKSQVRFAKPSLGN